MNKIFDWDAQTRRGGVITVNKTGANSVLFQYFYLYYIFIIGMNSQVKQIKKSVVEIILYLDEDFIFVLLLL